MSRDVVSLADLLGDEDESERGSINVSNLASSEVSGLTSRQGGESVNPLVLQIEELSRRVQHLEVCRAQEEVYRMIAEAWRNEAQQNLANFQNSILLLQAAMDRIAVLEQFQQSQAQQMQALSNVQNGQQANINQVRASSEQGLATIESRINAINVRVAAHDSSAPTIREELNTSRQALSVLSVRVQGIFAESARNKVRLDGLNTALRNVPQIQVGTSRKHRGHRSTIDGSIIPHENIDAIKRLMPPHCFQDLGYEDRAVFPTPEIQALARNFANATNP